MNEEKEIKNYLYEFTKEEFKAYRKESWNRTCIAFSGITWEEQFFLNKIMSDRIQNLEKENG